jgi:excinuclease ABC subunit C
MPDEKKNIEVIVNENDIVERLAHLPLSPGIYQFKNENGKVIYVGKAKNLRSRVRSYFHTDHTFNPKTNALVSKIKNIEIILTDNEIEALVLENNLIKSLKPRYNILLKDDKTFPYIVITNEPYPQVYPTRKLKKDGSKYFGPYTEVKIMKTALKIIRDIFQVRNCNYYLDDDIVKQKKVKLCLEYQIKKCGGPCEGLVSYEEYQNIIKNVIKLLNGKTAEIISSMESEMFKASNEMRFEDASVLKRKIDSLRVYSEKQKVVSLENIDRDIFALAYEDDDACGLIFKIRGGKLIDKRHFYLSHIEDKGEGEILENIVEGYYLENEFIPDEIYLQTELENKDIVHKWLCEKRKEEVKIIVPKSGEKEKLVSMCKINARYMLDELKLQKMKRDNYIPFSLKALQKDLRLKTLPRRIECFDISNIQGSDSVASMVYFEDGKPKKNEYRKFNIKTVEGINDFESIKEVVHRRYKRLIEENKSLPDLVVIDGGKGQLSNAIKALKELKIEGLSIIGLAKRLEEIYFPGLSDPQMLPKTSSSLKLLQNVRDEAHRFAVTFHREKRSHRILKTELENIKTVGYKKANKLLAELGSVEAVKKSSMEELSALVGKTSAESILNYMKNKNY